MPDATPGTEATEVLRTPTGNTSPAVSLRPFPVGNCKLATGERWKGYQIDGPSPTGGENVFEATHVGRMEQVLISATLLNKSTATRRGVWELLSTKLPEQAKIVTCVEAHEEEGWRYEVVQQPPATTLREWVACHQAEISTQNKLLEQVSATISALHSLGIVHLRIRPEVIYLGGEEDKPEIILGGLNTATFYKQAVINPVEVDPFYAPPEAMDAEGKSPGIGLCAWDWWSLGRVVQEMILGRHVMSGLFGHDVIRDPSPKVAERAKNLLLEIDPPGTRAGAVESMPTVAPTIKGMLRGLLTSARDARWGSESIARWLAKENVPNYYDLARNARFFTWQGRGRSIAEAAVFFRSAENWADGEMNLFDPENQETLVHFLTTVKEHKTDLIKLQQTHGQVSALEVSGVTDAGRRTLTAALTWLAFGPQPGTLVIKGRKMDVPGLTELLAMAQDAANFGALKMLISAPGLALITPLDATAGITLSQLATVGGAALRQGEQNGWIDPTDAETGTYVLKLSLESEPALRKRADRVRTTFAACENPVLAAMLADKNPALWVQVLLVVTGENPRRFGYVTRIEHTRQQLARLKARSEQLQVALFWLHLKQALQAGRPWSGRWHAFCVFWLGLVAFGVVLAQDVPATAALALILMGLRRILGWRVRKLAARWDKTLTVPWTWRDGPERCLAEAQRTWPESAAVLPELTRQYDEMKAAMASLQPVGSKAGSTNSVSWLAGLWPVFTAAALVCIVGSVQLLKNVGQNFGYQALSIAWNDPATEFDSKALAKSSGTTDEIAALLEKIPNLSPEMVAKVKNGEYEIVKEAFGYALHGPIEKWNFSPPAIIPPLPVESRETATAAQRAYALVSGELLLRPYGKKGVTAMFVISVPTKTGFGLMIYNAKSRKLVDNVALTVHEGLPDKTWYHVDRYNVIYLGAPSQMEITKGGIVSHAGEHTSSGSTPVAIVSMPSMP